MERRFLEQCLEQEMSLEAIGAAVSRHPSTVSYWLKKYSLKASGHDRHNPRGGIGRDDLEALVAEGLTLGEIADSLGVSYTNVRYWLAEYQVESPQRRHRRLMREAREQGLTRIELRCKRHGLVHYRSHHSSFRCGRCMSEAVARRRRKVKQLLLEEFGGSCAHCGYEGPPRALHFHHLDPSAKSFGVSAAGVTRSLAKVRQEAEKCVLLCSNCHAEVEEGLIALPVK